MKRWFLSSGAAAASLLSAVFLALIWPASVGATEVTLDVDKSQVFKASDCFECHDNVDKHAYANSVHGPNSCTSCHTDIIDLQKHSEGVYKPRKVNCTICHADIGKEFENSIHKNLLKFDCWECHSKPHAIQLWNGSKEAIIKKCAECHEDEGDAVSGHSAAVLRGNNDAAACSDCHGLHNTHRLHSNMEKYPAEARIFYNTACKKCHGDKDMMRRNNITTTAVDTYEKTYHGKIQKLGYSTHVAGCADCHTQHNILPKSDPNSTINPRNLIKNCGKCHKGVNANFVKFKPHADFLDRQKNPLLFWTVFAMSALLIFTFVFFWFHTALWWRKSYWEKQRRLIKGDVHGINTLEIDAPGDWLVRFKPIARVMHITLNAAFFGLVLTGMPLKFNTAPWAKIIIKFFGGAEVAGFIHRLMAAILLTLFAGAIVMSIRFVLDKKNGPTLLKRFFSPDSLFFRLKDWEDFRGMMRWFVDMGPMPKFDRWTYWEKFDFMAVFWGMFAIGSSGLILWMPEFTSKFLPGWIFNVAIIIHSDEAILAAGFIFTVHFFNTHFIPTKFPMDTVVFTGRMQKYKYYEEKALHYERLEKSGRLEQMKGEAPDLLTNLLSSAIGLIFLSLGIIMTVLIGIGLFK